MKPGPILALSFLMHCPDASADPRIDSWFTAHSAKYARIYATDAAKSSGTSLTTWTNGNQVQSSPAYCGVQEIAFSAEWVYIRTTGLGSHVMGPWYLNAAHTNLFPNYPKNQKALYRFPRTPVVPATKTLTGLGAIGYFVDGVAMFDSRDGFAWTGTAEAGNGTGYWNREAYVNEGVTFDPGYAHQENSGTHHYHANPIALRYLLGDHVDYNAATRTYSESIAPVTRHSPILGWVRDGYPIYGPYGYADAMDSTRGVRRMVSGYALRNGANGTDNLTVAGRNSIPSWAQRAYGVGAAQAGPAVSTTYPLGRYMEDNAYLGDLGGTQGADFDLDEFNGRYCVTPEFPGGTYAYFVSITASGVPAYPYNIGRSFHGMPSGSAQTSIAETVTTTFKGGADTQEAMEMPVLSGGDVTLTWSSVEGGTYTVEASERLDDDWSPLTTTRSAATDAVFTSHTETGGANHTRRFYRANRTATATYDPVTGTTGTGNTSTISPVSGNRGSSVGATITLAASTNPPPNNVQPTSVTLTRGGAATISATGTSRSTATGVITATFAIPANSTTGTYTVTCTFGPMSWTIVDGFTVN